MTTQKIKRDPGSKEVAEIMLTCEETMKIINL